MNLGHILMGYGTISKASFKVQDSIFDNIVKCTNNQSDANLKMEL